MKLHQHLFGNGKPLRCNAWAKPRRCAYICINYIYTYHRNAIGSGSGSYALLPSGIRPLWRLWRFQRADHSRLWQTQIDWFLDRCELLDRVVTTISFLHCTSYQVLIHTICQSTSQYKHAKYIKIHQNTSKYNILHNIVYKIVKIC